MRWRWQGKWEAGEGGELTRTGRERKAMPTLPLPSRQPQRREAAARTTALVPEGYSSMQYCRYLPVRASGVWGDCRRYILVSVRWPHTWVGVPIVCLPIWHWYMLRGDWLKSGYGVMEATIDSIACAPSSACEKASPGEPPAPPSGQWMCRLLCSSVPSSSTPPEARCRTGRIMRAACVKRKSPG